MEQIIEVALWIGGVFLLIISGLLGWIGFMTRADKKESKELTTKHENWILAQQKELNEVRNDTKTAIELIKVEQQFGKQRLESFIKFVEEGKYYVRGKRK